MEAEDGDDVESSSPAVAAVSVVSECEFMFRRKNIPARVAERKMRIIRKGHISSFFLSLEVAIFRERKYV